MKRLLMIGAAILAIACTNKKETASYNITVNLQGDSTQITSDSLMLTNFQKGNDLISQTVAIKDGKAVFTGTVTTPEVYYLVFPNNARNAFAGVFVENENYVVDLDFTKIKDGIFKESISTVKGGKTQKVIDSLENIMLSMQKEHNFDSPKYKGGIGLHTTGISKRRFLPNLQTVRVTDGKGNTSRKTICTRCLKAGKVTKA